MDFIETITNIRFLRVACRDLSYSELLSAQAKLAEIVEERRIEEEEKNKKNKERNDALAAIRSLMAQTGINAQDLTDLLSNGQLPNQTNKRNVPPKYRFTDAEGNELTWTGQGRTPTLFTECMQREGKDKDHYLISNNA